MGHIVTELEWADSVGFVGHVGVQTLPLVQWGDDLRVLSRSDVAWLVFQKESSVPVCRTIAGKGQKQERQVAPGMRG